MFGEIYCEEQINKNAVRRNPPDLRLEEVDVVLPGFPLGFNPEEVVTVGFPGAAEEQRLETHLVPLGQALQLFPFTYGLAPT